MKQFKGVQGTWWKYRDIIDADDGNSIARVQGCYSQEIEDANAKLIAAAPELLKALELIMSNSTDHAIIRIASKAINKALNND